MRNGSINQTAAMIAYTPTAALAVICCHFNPHRYATKTANFAAFIAPLAAAGIRTVVVECSFDGRFELPDAIQIRGRDVMWQKERLLNVALAHVPESVPHVAWLDADVLFTDPDWAVNTVRALDRFAVVQPFTRAVRLPRGATSDDGTGLAYPGFAAVYAAHPHRLLDGDFAGHGHTGFAWAARREVLALGLYDGCIAGSGDHMMAHAFCGDWHSACVGRIIGANPPHTAHFADWGRRVYRTVRARVGAVPGTLLHLWHGDVADRRYVDRNRELADFGFDPAADVRVGEGGCWEWATRKPKLHRWAWEYFGSRKEDG